MLEKLKKTGLKIGLLAALGLASLTSQSKASSQDVLKDLQGMGLHPCATDYQKITRVFPDPDKFPATISVDLYGIDSLTDSSVSAPAYFDFDNSLSTSALNAIQNVGGNYQTFFSTDSDHENKALTYLNQINPSFIKPVASTSSFKADSLENRIDIEAITAKEANAANINLLRNGNKITSFSSGQSKYRYTDSNLAPGTTYAYTLEAEDSDGQTKEIGKLEAFAKASPAPVPSEDVFYFYPNPCKNGKANFKYKNSSDCTEVEIDIYTISGELVKTIKCNPSKGMHTAQWDCGNEYGNKIASGIYLNVLKADKKKVKTAKSAVIK